MTCSDEPVKEQEINLLTALQTSFSKRAYPHAFLGRAQEQIGQVERDIVETCARNRIRIDDNLYALLESRDAIAEQQQELESATVSASEVTRNVDQAVKVLNEKMRVSRNLDAALSVAAQTRKLTRMYARIEDTIDSRRLYTAFRMLKVLEEETQVAKPGTFLQELVPDTHRLRATITLHARKYFHAWLDLVGKVETSIGSFAIHYVDRLVSEQNRTHLVPTTDVSSSTQLADQQDETGSRNNTQHSHSFSTGNQQKPWLPQLTSIATSSAGTVSRSQTPHSQCSQLNAAIGPRNTTLSPDKKNRIERNGDGPREVHLSYSDGREAPLLYLRPLLQSALVNDGLELTGEMRTEYRRERYLQLQKVLDELRTTKEQSRFVAPPASQMRATGAPPIEQTLFRVCGFFVVEKCVQLHSNPTILQKSIIDNEWWLPTYQEVVSLLRGRCESNSASSANKASIRELIVSLNRFAHVYGLPT